MLIQVVKRSKRWMESQGYDAQTYVVVELLTVSPIRGGVVVPL